MFLDELEKFLAGVDLDSYRKRFLPIKIVEMDMPKNVQAIAFMYKIYWIEKRLLDFDSFYKEYLDFYKNPIRDFQVKTQMCEDCFYKGLPARIYRTWASIITQIQGGYVAESVFGSGTVEMSEELDHQGADFRVTYKGKILNYQVKKETHSREVRAEKKTTKVMEGEFLPIKYVVPSRDIFEKPLKRNGEPKKAYREFIENKALKRFPNGFVVFTSEAFLGKKQEIDKVLVIVD